MGETALTSSADTPEKKQRGHVRHRTGVVASDKGDKSIIVVCEYLTRHPKYGKVLRRRTRVHAHDEKNEAKTGDRVQVAACRRLSKTKTWRLVKVLGRGALARPAGR